MDILDQAYAEINALGGADQGEYWQGYDKALDDALAIIERLLAEQRVVQIERRAA